MGTARWLWAGLLLSAAGPARADVGEGSLRCGPEARRAAERAGTRAAGAWSIGGGCAVGLGLSPTLTVLLRYDYTRSGKLRVPTRESGTALALRLERHDAQAGLAFAPWDEWTPVVELTAGLAAATQRERAMMLVGKGAEQVIEPPLPDRFEWRPLVRAAGLWEWRFLDFFAVAGGPTAEWAGGFGVGGLLQVAAYRYL